MVGWHHQFHAREFEQTPGDGEGQGSQACCSSWGHREGQGLVTEQQQQSIKGRPSNKEQPECPLVAGERGNILFHPECKFRY